MKNIMKRAWEIAKSGVEKFGGKVKEYFAEALKMAWAEAKQPATKEVTVQDLNEALEEMYGGYSASVWKKYGHERIYVNYTTGGGSKRSTGFFVLQDGVIMEKSKDRCDNVAYKLFQKFEGYKVVA